MFIKVMSRVELESEFYLAVKESSMPHIILSTTSNRANPIVSIKENPNCRGILRFQFDDIDLRHKKYLVENNKVTKYNLFYVEHAKSILNFINDNIYKVESIITGCDAGISRSSAMAASLSKIILGEDDYFFKHYLPNMLVYTEILKEYNYNMDVYKNICKFNSTL